MARLASVTPLHNPYRENPSGLLIGGVIVALAAAGGAGWYFLGRKATGSAVKETELNQSSFSQLDQKRKDLVLRMDFAMGKMMGWDKKKFVEAKDRIVQRMLNPELHDEEYGNWVKQQVESTGRVKFADYPNPKTVTMAEADKLTAPGGKYRFNTNFTTVELLPELRPKTDRKKAKAARKKAKAQN